MTTTKHQGLYEKIASILPKLGCNPASILNFQEELLALQLSKHILHISLPIWLVQESVSKSKDFFVITAPAVEGMNEECSLELRDILLQANECAQRIEPGPDALLKMVELLGKAIAGMNSAAADSGEEEDDNFWYADDGKVVGSTFLDVGIGKGSDEQETVVCKTRRHAPLHKRAEAAARACLYARATSGCGTNHGGEASSSSTRLCKDGEYDAKLGLRWCRVESRPRDLSVYLHFDMGRLIVDKRAAVHLGFDMDLPLQIKLSYDGITWGSQARSPVPDSVIVNEVSVTQGLPRYGPQTMLKEMVRTYYQDHQGSGRKRKQGDSAHEPSNNEFLDLMLVIVERLQKLTWSCIICDKPFDMPNLQIRPCSKEFCVFKFQEVRLGSPILRQLQEASQVVQVELSFASAAARSRRDVFTPYPCFLPLKHRVRNRDGVFTTEQGTGPEQEAAADEDEDEDEDEDKDKDKETLLVLGRLPMPMYPGDNPWLKPSNKQLKALGDILDSLPKVSAMAESENEKEVATLINHHLTEQKHLASLLKTPDGKLSLGYDVMRFVLSSNPLHLREIQTEDWLPIPNTVAQIAVLSDRPDRELAFAERMQMTQSSSSSFAFHGSPLENWYSIMRNGLRALSKTKYMRSGNSYGDGLYLSTVMGISIPYSRAGSGWGDFSKYPVSACAIVEIAPVSFVNGKSSEGVMVVSKEDEAAVAIRYILIFETYENQPSTRFSKCTISGTRMGAVDLKDHFENQKLLYKKEQQAALELEAAGATKERTRHRTRASDRIVVEVPLEPEPYPRFTSVEKFSIQPTPNATSTILREYQKLMKLQMSPGSSLPRGSFTAAIPDETNVYRWRITLQPCLFSDTIQKDLAAHARKKGFSWVVGGGGGTPIIMEMIFSGEFPFKPPFLRVVSPVFVFRTGHVTSGGSICMELLTDSGWSPACSVESVLVQAISAICEGKGRIDLNNHINGTYSEREARLSFLQVARQHLWKV